MLVLGKSRYTVCIDSNSCRESIFNHETTGLLNSNKYLECLLNIHWKLAHTLVYMVSHSIDSLIYLLN